MEGILNCILNIFNKLGELSSLILVILLTVLQLKKIFAEKPKLIINNFRAFFPLSKLPVSMEHKQSFQEINKYNTNENVNYLYLNYVVNNVSEKPNSIIKIKYKLNNNYINRATSYILASLKENDQFCVFEGVNDKDERKKSNFKVPAEELPRPNMFLESGQSIVISDVITTQNFNVGKDKLYIEIEDAFNKLYLSPQVLDKDKKPQYFSYLME